MSEDAGISRCSGQTTMAALSVKDHDSTRGDCTDRRSIRLKTDATALRRGESRTQLHYEED